MYTLEEDMRILEFVLENRRYLKKGGNDIWKKAEKLKVEWKQEMCMLTWKALIKS